MIPDEDRGPAWLRDYGDIEADLRAMEEFAAALKEDVERGYAPRALAVSDTMVSALPEADERFAELRQFRQAHERAREAALRNVCDFTDGTYGLADAAHEVSERYRGSDAFARARVTDVQAGFRTTATADRLPPDRDSRMRDDGGAG
ncbi:hypothetical protein AB0M02_02010 [Actinoplanes sp. NPDC051861]|uniref:hypothetical protein n=1 Tax=Actinoplanes sp. NPDC051861 TaxID=3155170 RepID=UPI0034180823